MPAIATLERLGSAMKKILIVIALLMLAGCGDSNYYTAQTTTPGETMITDPAPIVAGAAGYIPSNTYCTTDMNTVFAANGTPVSVHIAEDQSSFHITFDYSTGSETKRYYFDWVKYGYFPSIGPCVVSYIHYYTVTP